MRDGYYLDENFIERPLPVYTVSEDHYVKCPEHGEMATHAYYDEQDIVSMLVNDGHILCPLCLDRICGGM